MTRDTKISCVMKEQDVLVLPDLHAPYHDIRTVAAVEKLLAASPWDEIIQIGDFMDFDCVSSHNIGKLRTIEGKTVAGDYRVANRLLDRWQKLAPKARWTILEGNHDERILRYIDANPQMAGSLEVPVGLHLIDRGIKWIPSWSTGEIYTLGNANFIHGKYINEHHAKKHVSRFGVNIFYGHCVSQDTEVLTPTGWVTREKVIPGKTLILTLNKVTHRQEWDVVKSVKSFNDFTELLRIKGDHTDLLVTPQHGMIGFKSPQQKSLEEYTADRLMEKKGGRWLIHGGVLSKTGVELSDDELRLAVWVAADGHKRESNGVAFGMKKARKIQRLTTLLKDLNVTFSQTFRSGETWIDFNLKQTPRLGALFVGAKRLPKEFANCTPEQAKVVFTEYTHTDGCVRQGTLSLRCYTIKRVEADLLQYMAITNGFKCCLTVQHNERHNAKAAPLYVLNIHPRICTHIQPASNAVKSVHYQGYVWCPTVENGTVFFRRNGKVVLTQNCHDTQCFPQVLMGDDKTIVGQSLGCLCDYSQSYMKNSPSNWQQAVTTFHFWPDGYFQYNLMRIFGHRFEWRGKTFQG